MSTFSALLGRDVALDKSTYTSLNLTRRSVLGLAATAASVTATVTKAPEDDRGQSRSVITFGAVGDGRDDTEALQRAVDWCCVRPGRKLSWPQRTFVIHRALNIPASDGWFFQGESRGRSCITQNKDDEPVFRFVGDLTHGWSIEKLTIGHARPQPFNYAKAVGIYFDSPAHSSVFNFEVSNCLFTNSRRAVGISRNYSQQSVWGASFRKCVGTKTLSGAFIALVPTPAVGQPSISVTECYIDTQTSILNESTIQISYCDNVKIDTVEFNNGHFKGDRHNIMISGSTGVILNSKSENISASGNSRIWLIEESNLTIIGCRMNGVEGNGNGIAGIGIVSKSSVNILTFSFSAAAAVAPIVPYWIDGSSSISIVAGIKLVGPAVTDNVRQIFGNVSVPYINADQNVGNFISEVGDQDITVEPPYARIYRYSTALTEQRRHFLPSPQAYPKNAEYSILRDANPHNRYDITIIDRYSGKDYVILSDKKKYIKYFNTGLSWIILHTSDM